MIAIYNTWVNRMSLQMLDGTFVACGSGISKRPDVVFKVSFSTAIMSLVFCFKSWKQNNGVLTSF